MKKKLKIFGVGICCIVVLMINIFANVSVNPSNTDLSSLVSTAMADGEGYGNGHYGFCYSGCWPEGVEIVCYPWPNSYCIPVGCSAGWC